MKQANGEIKSKIMLIASVFIFGTVGIFRRYIPLPSGSIALVRGVIGALFLLMILAIKKQKLSLGDIRRNLLFLCISGVFIGFNWILLFEAYVYTTVATATLCYYMAPIFVIILSPILLKERITLKKGICVAVALFGMVLVSGVIQGGLGGVADFKGILLGLGAAVLYAGVMLLNQKIKDISAYDKTIVQLAAATVVLIPYIILAEDISAAEITAKVIVFMLIVGIVNTGVAYLFYFGSMENLSGQTVALFSYIDPIVAIILSALFLKEKMGVPEIIGAVLVLGATIVSELPEKQIK